MRLFLPALLGLGFLAMFLMAGSPSAADDLAAQFVQPPAAARPWVFWFWMNGNITREGIKADLEAMHRVGIGGALIMAIDKGTPAGPVKFASPEWREMFKFAVSEADRLGLQINMNNDAGWCGSMGPWVTPELAEQQLVWTEAVIPGGSHYDAVPAKPETNGGYYRDVAVLAFPTPLDDDLKVADFSPKITASAPVPEEELQKLASGSPGCKITLPGPSPDKPQYVQFEFPRPFPARSLNLILEGSKKNAFQGELQTSGDGVHFKRVLPLSGKFPGAHFAFDRVDSRCFRILFTKVPTKSFTILQLDLGARGRIGDWPTKTLVKRGESPAPATYPGGSKEISIDPANVIDLTDKMDGQGHLVWDAPAGKWTLLRLGHTSKPATTRDTAPLEGRGLECDKLSKEAMDAHFAGLMGKLISDVGTLAGKSLVGTHIDSWETGTQNWTARFPEEFQARRGYDLRRHLPAMTGRVVGNHEITERFLWDFRRTVAELLNENYAGRLAELAHRHGMRLSTEAYGDGPAENLSYAGRADEPMREFWWTKADGPVREDIPTVNVPKSLGDIEMTSAAHVYGKPVVGMEAFTSGGDERWLAYPGNMKAMADWAFGMGTNKLVFHRYAMQPWLDRKPGMCMGPFGVHYERTQTWWETARPWHDYLSRCQYLLRQGLFVADICYLQPEGAPQSFHIPLEPGYNVPERPGYNFDGAPAEAILTRFSVKNGRLVLPDGMSYKTLVLPDTPAMTPALLRKIKQLISDGATVIGHPPSKSPSLSGYPACDDEVQSLVKEIWGDCDGKTVFEHALGAGKIIRGIQPEAVMKQMGLPPDLEKDGASGKIDLIYTHRTVGDSEVYFVSNFQDQAIAGAWNFRVQGKRPEFWWPETGRIEPVAAYEEKGRITKIPLHLEPAESVFVVFRPNSARYDPVTSILLNGQPTAASLRLDPDGRLHLQASKSGAYEIKTASGKAKRVTIDQIPASLDIPGPWELAFPPDWGAPKSISLNQLMSWSDHGDDGVKHFSGSATYAKKFQMPAELLAKGNRLCLDLGDVRVIAAVKLNGRDLGILWKPPFVVDVTDAVKADNALEVTVTNLWPNRLIGDAQLPEDSERLADGSIKSWPKWLEEGKASPTGRLTFATWNLWKKNDRLLPSGLLGPVKLRAGVEVALP